MKRDAILNEIKDLHEQDQSTARKTNSGEQEEQREKNGYAQKYR